MKMLLAVSVLFLPIAIAYGNGRSGTFNADSVIPPDAQRVTHDNIGRAKQILFTVHRKYPAFAFNQDTLKRLTLDGWKECHSGSDEWNSFVDVSGGERITVHQKILHFRKANQVLLLVGRYKSASGPASEGPARVPDSDQQIANVSVTPGSESDIQEILNVFHARC